jgi:hypothetical protein
LTFARKTRAQAIDINAVADNVYPTLESCISQKAISTPIAMVAKFDTIVSQHRINHTSECPSRIRNAFGGVVGLKSDSIRTICLALFSAALDTHPTGRSQLAPKRQDLEQVEAAAAKLGGYPNQRTRILESSSCKAN